MPHPAGDKDVEIPDHRRQPLEGYLVVVLQQQRQILPRRKRIAGQIEEGIKRFIAADVHAIALKRQPEHSHNTQDASRRQHPQADPAANNADKQENGESDNDIRAGTADNGIGQQPKRHGAEQEEYPRLIILAQEIDHQHRRDKEIEKALQRHAGDFGREDLTVRVELKQQEAIVGKENPDAQQRYAQQNDPCQMRFHAVHRK